jgi:DNA-binding beta-propeller fold protein YncE
VACSEDKSIYIIDATTDTAQGPFLRPLGRGQSLLDVVVTPDGGTAIVSNFDGNIIYFIDLTAPTPAVLGSVLTTFSAEDIALSPDGRWALVTDGSGKDRIASIDVLNREVVQTLVGPRMAQAIAIAADGETVLTADTDNDRVHVLHLSPEDGELTYTEQHLITGDAPINVAISPDGRTALVANFWDDMVTVLRIDGPADVVKIGELGHLPGGQQSIAFSPNGQEAYVVSVDPDPDQLSVLDVKGPGNVTDSGIKIDLDTRAWWCGFFGVDCLAVSPDGSKAYVGNPCDNPNWGNPIEEVTIVDLIEYRVMGRIHVGPYPVGVAFFNTR